MTWQSMEEFEMKIRALDVQDKLVVVYLDGPGILPDKDAIQKVDHLVRYAGGKGVLFLEKNMDIETLTPWQIKKLKEQMDTVE